MNIDEIRNVLRRKAVNFQTGGFRTTNEMGESWTTPSDERVARYLLISNALIQTNLQNHFYLYM